MILYAIVTKKNDVYDRIKTRLTYRSKLSEEEYILYCNFVEICKMFDMAQITEQDNMVSICVLNMFLPSDFQEYCKKFNQCIKIYEETENVECIYGRKLLEYFLEKRERLLVDLNNTIATVVVNMQNEIDFLEKQYTSNTTNNMDNMNENHKENDLTNTTNGEENDVNHNNNPNEIDFAKYLENKKEINKQSCDTFYKLLSEVYNNSSDSLNKLKDMLISLNVLSNKDYSKFNDIFFHKYRIDHSK